MPATDSYFRNVKRVHVVFAVSSVALFVTTIWMMAADHTDEWRDYQATFDEIQADQLITGRQEYETEQYQQQVAAGQAKRQEARAALDQQKATLDELMQEVESLRLEVDLASRAVRFQRANRDVARANLDLGIRDNLDSAPINQLRAAFESEQDEVDKLELDLQQKQTRLDMALTKLNAQTGDLDEAEANLKELQADLDRLETAYSKVAPTGFSGFKRWLMLQPIVDGFNSPHKIIQDWLPDLPITLGMTSTARFDRCRTCHLGIDQIESGGVPAYPFGESETNSIADWVGRKKFPHPFATHPRPELYTTASSPHPVTTFGCTICHDGNGAGTSFQNAEHGPNDPHQAHEWENHHHYHPNHFWEYPMQPKRFVESTCIKCHHSVIELGVNPTYGPTAPKVVQGYQLIQKFGCFGCHEIHGFDAGKPIGPDIRLEPQTEEEAQKIAADAALVAGRMRKVGPSLEHIASKTTPEWIAYWTEEPKRFRPQTRMPQFFKLTNQHDPHAQKLMPVEIAGIAQYLMDKSAPLELMQPADGYEPDTARGKVLFSRRGCLGCHSHDAFPKITQDFGPNLSNVHAKIKPGEDGFRWLYTWLNNPELHHPRTRMPNLYLEPYSEGDSRIDPAADIAASLLEKGPGQFPAIAVDDETLDELVTLFLSKVLTKQQTAETLQSHVYPYAAESIKGDEIELAVKDGNGTPVGDEQWRQMKLNYVGRRTISRYGCYGCHNVSGFETARPIGTTLQDWGRKDTSKLALEHIKEYLHEHGEPDGSSTHERVTEALKKANAGGLEAGEFRDHHEEDREMSAVHFYESLLHHGRPGFIWQKLRQPRSYDFEKIETKGYDERLRMPKFPLNEEEIEAIATFVLGLVAEPPPEQYLFRPQGAVADRIEGERLIERFNCAGCHMFDLPEVRFGVNVDELFGAELSAADHPEALDLLLQLKPPRDAFTGDKLPTGEPIISFHGLPVGRPDPENDPEDQEYTFDLWETLDVGEKRLLPSARMIVPVPKLHEIRPARGGQFAEWLVDSLVNSGTGIDLARAWQMSPPPLYKEGIKVQTPWLYQFLREPNRVRETTVLRMPRFNLDPDEARSLANYFAAVDGAAYPYQRIREQEPEYLAEKDRELGFPNSQSVDYLAESWKLLNAPLCVGCHAVAGRPFQKSDDPKQVQGPDLKLVSERLRPEWTLLWLYQPRWITPYTSMPPPYSADPTQKKYTELFGGDGKLQTIATRDALLNYHRLMEREGKTIYEPPAAEAAASGGN